MTRADLIEHLDFALRHGDRTVYLPLEDLRRELGVQPERRTITSEYGTTPCRCTLDDCARCNGCQK